MLRGDKPPGGQNLRGADRQRLPSALHWTTSARQTTAFYANRCLLGGLPAEDADLYALIGLGRPSLRC